MGKDKEQPRLDTVVIRVDAIRRGRRVQDLSATAAQSAAALKLSEDLAQILYKSYDAVLVSDCRGVIRHINDRAQQVFALHKEQFYSCNIRDLLLGVDDNFMSTIRASLHNRRHLVIEAEAYHANEGSFPCEVTVSLVEVDAEELLFFSVRNISRRLMAERELQESEQRLRQLIELSSDWIWEADDSAYFSFVSDRVSDSLGFQADQMCGKRIFDFLLPEAAQTLYDGILQMVRYHESSRSFELDFFASDGTCRRSALSVATVFSEDRRLRLLRGTVRDISEQQRQRSELEQQRNALQQMNEQLLSNSFKLKASEQMASLGEVAVDIARQLDLPLQDIDNNLNRLNERVAGLRLKTRAAQKRLSQTTSRQGLRLDATESGTQWQQDNLQPVLDDCSDLLKGTAEEVEQIADLLQGLQSLALSLNPQDPDPPQ